MNHETEDLPEVEIVETDEGGAADQESNASPEDLGIDLPQDPEEAIGVLVSHVSEARSQAESHLDDLRRVAAEFDNFRKRSQRDQELLHRRASERVVTAMLPVLDSFDAALSIEPTTETEHKMLGGMRSTYDQLMTVLSKEGLSIVDTVGEPFDPEVHEAVMSSGDGERLIVSQELRRGYKMGDRVLRAALVALESESDES